MHEKQAKFVRFGVFLFATAAVALSLSGQQSNHVRTSLVTDWSSRHLIFSAPCDVRETRSRVTGSSLPAAMAAAQHASCASDGRRRTRRRSAPQDTTIDALETNPDALFGGLGGGLGIETRWNGAMKKDWSTSLGPTRDSRRGLLPRKVFL